MQELLAGVPKTLTLKVFYVKTKCRKSAVESVTRDWRGSSGYGRELEFKLKFG